MAPLLNSRTASMINKLLQNFRLSLRDVPSDVKGIVYFLCSFVFVVILCYCSIFTVYFVITPLLPQYHPTVKLDSVNVTSLNIQAINLMATFNITFVFKPSKYDDRTVSYNNLEVKVWWAGKDDITLAKAWLKPFTQRIGSMTKVGVILTIANGFSNDSDVVKGIAAELGRGIVNFGVSLFGLVQFEDDSSETLRYVCNPVVIVFTPGSNNGTWKTLVVPPGKLHRD